MPLQPNNHLFCMYHWWIAWLAKNSFHIAWSQCSYVIIQLRFFYVILGNWEAIIYQTKNQWVTFTVALTHNSSHLHSQCSNLNGTARYGRIWNNFQLQSFKIAIVTSKNSQGIICNGYYYIWSEKPVYFHLVC